MPLLPHPECGLGHVQSPPPTTHASVWCRSASAAECVYVFVTLQYVGLRFGVFRVKLHSEQWKVGDRKSSRCSIVMSERALSAAVAASSTQLLVRTARCEYDSEREGGSGMIGEHVHVNQVRGAYSCSSP